MRAPVLHLRDLCLGVVRIVPIRVRPFFLRLRSTRARAPASASRCPTFWPGPSDTPHSCAHRRASRLTYRRVRFQRRPVHAEGLPADQPRAVQHAQYPLNTAWWVSRSSSRRVREIVECSGVNLLAGIPRKSRRLSESAARHAIPRSLSIPSKYPSSRHRKYTPGDMLGRPSFRVELRTGPFANLSNPFSAKTLVDRLIVRVALRTKLLVRDEQVLLLSIAGAHCHTVFVHHRRSAVDLDQVFRSSDEQQSRPSASTAQLD